MLPHAPRLTRLRPREGPLGRAGGLKGTKGSFALSACPVFWEALNGGVPLIGRLYCLGCVCNLRDDRVHNIGARRRWAPSWCVFHANGRYLYGGGLALV
jgi:hypothetical protein